MKQETEIHAGFHPSLGTSQKVSRSLTLRHDAHVTHLISSCCTGSASSRIITRKRIHSVQSDVLRETSHVIFTTVYFYNCSTLLLLIVNFSLCPIHKLYFITGVYA